MTRERLDEIAAATLDSAFEVHTTLGPGLLEGVYKACLAFELEARGLSVELESPVPVIYRDHKITDVGYRMDLLVEGQLVVEVKTVDALHPVHLAQILSYLRLSDRRLGLLINFNTALLKDGIRRVVNRF